jgi:hypothetical protein
MKRLGICEISESTLWDKIPRSKMSKLFSLPARKATPAPLLLRRDRTGQKRFVIVHRRADLKKSSVHILVGIRMVAHHREFPTAFNSRRLHHLVPRPKARTGILRLLNRSVEMVLVIVSRS